MYKFPVKLLVNFSLPLSERMVPLNVFVPMVIFEGELSSVKPAEAGIISGVPVAIFRLPVRL